MQRKSQELHFCFKLFFFFFFFFFFSQSVVLIIILSVKLIRISTLSFMKIIYALTEVLKNLHTHCERNIHVYHKNAKYTKKLLN